MVVNQDWERFLTQQRQKHPLYQEGVTAERERIIRLIMTEGSAAFDKHYLVEIIREECG